jgi:toxin ParE1/3/4
MIPFVLTRDARSSLKSIAIYTQQRWGEAQRRTYLKALDEQFHAISHFPMKGVARPEIFPALRSDRYHDHIIYYMIDGQRIIIVNILHQRMDPRHHITTAIEA